MELTELKSFKNAGGNIYSSIGSSGGSKTVEYKQINNLPKFENGIITSNSTSDLQYSFQAPTIERTVGQNNINMSDSSNLSAIQKANIRAGGTGEYNNYTKSAIGLNTGSLTKNSISTGNKINTTGVGGAVTSGIQFVGDSINAFQVNETGEDIAQKYGTSQQSIGGVNYESQNMIDASKEMDRVRKENLRNTLITTGSGAAAGAAIGAAAGSVVPGIGTAIGALAGLAIGIFGGASRRRNYQRMITKQNELINTLQDSARFSAQTKAIQQQNARQYGNSEAQYLYGAADGKVDTSFITPDAYFQTHYAPEIKEYNKNKLTYSALGPVNAEPNAKVSRGEIIANKLLGTMYRVPGGKDNKDTEYAYLSDSDTVVTNKGGESDRAFATGDIIQSEINMMNRNKKRGLMMAKNGKLPKCEEGWIGNAITSGLGVIGGASQYLGASNSELRKTKVYRPNDYEGVSLDILSRLGISPFPTMQNLRNAEARANRAIDMSGGLTTGQRTLTRLASLNNTQRAVADALQNIQMQNNNYFADYAKTALAAGAANAQRAMQANMYDEEMYAKAHAARQQGMQMGTWNMLNQLQQYWANEFKRRQFNETMGLYKQDQKLRADEIQALLKGNSSLAKNMYDYTKKRMGDYMIGKAATNTMFNPTKATTYKNLTGKWLAGYNFNQKPSIPYIKTR